MLSQFAIHSHGPITWPRILTLTSKDSATKFSGDPTLSEVAVNDPMLEKAGDVVSWVAGGLAVAGIVALGAAALQRTPG